MKPRGGLKVPSRGDKNTDGFAVLTPSIGVSFALLSQAARDIPLGTVDAVWTGIGVAGTAVMGMLPFGELRRLLRIACLGLVIAGSISMKLFS